MGLTMIQYAVTRKDGDWTVFRDGEALSGNLSRSSAIQMARDLAFQAEESGQVVEVLVQGYYGEMERRITGVAED